MELDPQVARSPGLISGAEAKGGLPVLGNSLHVCLSQNPSIGKICEWAFGLFSLRVINQLHTRPDAAQPEVHTCTLTVHTRKHSLGPACHFPEVGGGTLLEKPWLPMAAWPSRVPEPSRIKSSRLGRQDVLVVGETGRGMSH